MFFFIFVYTILCSMATIESSYTSMYKEEVIRETLDKNYVMRSKNKNLDDLEQIMFYAQNEQHREKIYEFMGRYNIYNFDSFLEKQKEQVECIINDIILEKVNPSKKSNSSGGHISLSPAGHELYCEILENEQFCFDVIFSNIDSNGLRFRNYPRQETLAHVALRCKRPAMFQSILTRSHELNLMISEVSNNRDMPEHKHVPYKNSRNYDGKSLAHYAVCYQNEEALNLLRMQNADLEQKDRNGMTPFAIAVKLDCENIIDNFLTQGIDCNKTPVNVCSTNKNGSQPLHYVKSESVAKKLIAQGALVQCRNRFGSQPIHYVRSCELVDIFYDAGANVCAQNNCGFSPLHYTKQLAVTKKLVEKGADARVKTHSLEVINKRQVLEKVQKTPREYIESNYKMALQTDPLAGDQFSNEPHSELIRFLYQAERKKLDEDDRRSSTLGAERNNSTSLKLISLGKRTVNPCQLQNMELSAPMNNEMEQVCQQPRRTNDQFSLGTKYGSCTA